MQIELRTHQRKEPVDITSQVAEAVRNSGIQEGLCVVYCPHTTAGLFINENADPSVARDIFDKLDELVPSSGAYHHLEGNADAHIKSSIIGCSLYIPVDGGRLALGRWQGIFFAEFDGPRNRRVIVKVQ